jgi:hypothetical protein
MTNYFLALGAVVGFGWLFANAPSPASTPRPAPARAMTAEPAIPPSSGIAEARQAPVPLVRNHPLPASAVAPQPPARDPEVQAQDDLDRQAAKAAIEADGYKRVTILGKKANGAWRAKGYRGATEVTLTADGTGAVSME